MPTKLRRYTISWPDDLWQLIDKDAQSSDRHFANMVIHILRQHYKGETRQKSPAIYSNSQLLSLMEVARLLGKSRVTIWRLTHRKNDPLPATRIGRSPLYQFDKLQWWLEKNAIN